MKKKKIKSFFIKPHALVQRVGIMEGLVTVKACASYFPQRNQFNFGQHSWPI